MHYGYFLGALLLFFDYDGTLVEIAPRPELARPTPELFKLLRRLASQEDMRVLVVSGRPLRELQELLSVSGLHNSHCSCG
jgi:trehalose 6-phosphate phosphatase